TRRPRLPNVLRSPCGSSPVRTFAPSEGIHQSPGGSDDVIGARPQIAAGIDSIVIGHRGRVDRLAQIIRAVSLPKGWIVVLREVSAVTTAHVIPWPPVAGVAVSPALEGELVGRPILDINPRRFRGRNPVTVWHDLPLRGKGRDRR